MSRGVAGSSPDSSPEGAQVGGTGRAPAPPGSGHAAPGVTLHSGLGGGARPVRQPVCPFVRWPVAPPEPRNLQPHSAERLALGLRSAGGGPEARRLAKRDQWGGGPAAGPAPSRAAPPYSRLPGAALRPGGTDGPTQAGHPALLAAAAAGAGPRGEA